MAGATFLAEGKTKVTILTEEPEDGIFSPTPEELNGESAIQADADVLTSDFEWTSADSDSLTDQKPLRQKGNTVVYGASNYTTAMTVFRRFDDDSGQDDFENESLWQAVKNKNSDLYVYVRETGKDADEEWEDGDESYLCGHVKTDSTQRIDGEGFIRRRVPMGPQNLRENIRVGGRSSGGGSGE